jgi:hypothetical protein
VKRRIFNAIAVLSAVMCVATVVLWVRSHWIADFVGRYDGHGGACGLISHNGTLMLFVDRWGFGNQNGFYHNTDPSER